MTQLRALQDIRRAKAALHAVSQQSVENPRLDFVTRELDRIERMAEAEWPIPQAELATIQIGLFAVRELEGSEDDLATLLENLDYDLKHPS